MWEEEWKKEKTIFLGLYGNRITEVSPFTLPLTKGPSYYFLGVFFFSFFITQKCFEKGKIVHPPTHKSHTHLMLKKPKPKKTLKNKTICIHKKNDMDDHMSVKTYPIFFFFFFLTKKPIKLHFLDMMIMKKKKNKKFSRFSLSSSTCSLAVTKGITGVFFYLRLLICLSSD
jgi:hypothetical protein